MEAIANTFVGIDGGGTKTVAVLATADGRIVATARGGSGNPTSLGAARFEATLRALLAELLADRPPSTVRHATLGLAGVGDPSVRAHVRDVCVRAGLADVTVITDAELHHDAAHGDAPGIVLAVGTGSVATGRGVGGSLVVCGGWGYLLGDDGSGYAIGRAAIRAALDAHERGAAPDALVSALLAHYDASAAPELIATVHAAPCPQARVAEAATIVAACAAAGEATARALVDAAARDLVTLARRAIDRAELVRPVPTVLVGGLLEPGGPLATAFDRAAHDAGLALERRDLRRTTLGAAIARAVASTDLTPDPSAQERIDAIDLP